MSQIELQSSRRGSRGRLPLLLLLCLLLIWQPTEALAAEGERPAARIVVVQVEANHTVEVGIELTGSDVRGVGAVLHYNSSKLKLLSWGTGKTPIALSGTPGYANAVAVHTKGPDGLMGKPALAWKSTASAAPTSGTAIAWNGIYLGADSLVETTLEQERVVTVRFAYETESGSTEEERAAEAALTEDVLGSYLKLADSAEAANTPVGAPFTLICQKGQGDPVYYEPEDGSDGSGETGGDTGSGADSGTSSGAGVQTIALPFVLMKGASVDGGGTVTGGGPVVVFFDWDGGVMDAIALPEQAEERPAAIAAFQNRAAIAAELSGKKGYAFDQWLLVTRQGEELVTANGTFTSNDMPLDLTDPLVRGDVADFSKTELPPSLLVQAAYRATETINTPGSGAKDAQLTQYTVELTDCMQYGQSSGSDGKFAVTFQVKRENVGGAGVTRLRKPAVAVFFRQVDSSLPDIITKVDLTNTDVTTFEVVPTKAIGEVMVYIIDASTVSAWPNAAEKSARGSVPQGVFKQQGSFAFLVKQCREKLKAEEAGAAEPADWANVNESAFYDATGITVPADKKEAAKNGAKEAVATHGDGITLEQMKAAVNAAVQ